MAKYLGIDVGAGYVRVVVARTSYRRFTLEAMAQLDASAAPSLEELVRAAAMPFIVRGEPLAVDLEGEKTFVRRLEIPAAAQKQLAEVLPYELESELPFELADAVYDHSVLPRPADGDGVPVFAVVARTEDVRARIDLVKRATGEEPERVVPGGLGFPALSAIVPELGAPGPVGLLELEQARAELVILDRGEVAFARTLSRGTEGLPESAPLLGRELKQSFAAWRIADGARPVVLYLVGSGAEAPGACEFLRRELGLDVELLPRPAAAEGEEDKLAALPRFARAAALALSLATRSKGHNLRRGPLAYERGYGFLRDRAPLLSGLFAVVLFSFFFATWAELRALGLERQSLAAALSSVTQDVFGEATSDPSRAADLLDKSSLGSDEDPLPHADAFDVMVQIAQAVPEGMTHDIEDLDVTRGHVTLHGIVPTIPDAQQIRTTLAAVRCFQDVKVVRTNQVVGEDRQKYALELDIKCPSEGKEKERAAAAAAASAAAPSTSGGKP